ncbi:hypothetical protein B0H11DRAFT_2245524 [Mycena galericulata]|nr:hypothetical protein B0H11DRAFT_2245524 [Mycena galericulata]
MSLFFFPHSPSAWTVAPLLPSVKSLSKLFWTLGIHSLSIRVLCPNILAHFICMNRISPDTGFRISLSIRYGLHLKSCSRYVVERLAQVQMSTAAVRGYDAAQCCKADSSAHILLSPRPLSVCLTPFTSRHIVELTPLPPAPHIPPRTAPSVPFRRSNYTSTSGSGWSSAWSDSGSSDRDAVFVGSPSENGWFEVGVGGRESVARLGAEGGWHALGLGFSSEFAQRQARAVPAPEPL